MTSKLDVSFNSIVINLFLLFFTFNSVAQEISKNQKNSKALLKKIEKEYHPEVIGISENGLIKGRNALKKYLIDFHERNGAEVDYTTDYKVAVLEALEYEIGSSKTDKGGEFAHILIWSKEKSSPQIIAEVVFEKSGNPEVPAELAKARDNWVEFCNKNNAKDLVEALYTEDAIYYNRGRVLRGHDQLSREYSYMDNPAYTLQLNPKHIEMVSDKMVFEIGRCSGSYPLPYILVWKMQNDGSWKIYFDSNY